MIRRGLAPLLKLLGALLLAVSPAPTLAQAAEPEPLAVIAGREGYAFDQPRILVQQRLLGIAHGVSLLASACMDMPAHIDATLTAYLAWRKSQENAVALAQLDLARHYFGARAAEARWPDVLRALNLKNQLDLAPGSAELVAACATLPAALSRPRYALDRQFRLQGLLAEATAGIEAELRSGWCRKHLDGKVRRLFEARFDAWYEINAPRLAQAGAALKAEWPVEAPAESFAEWEAMLRDEVRVRGSVDDCMAFSEKIKSPQAALRQLFAPPPDSPP